LNWLRKLIGPKQNQKAVPSPSEIAAFFNEASKDEEHFPSTIDERILHVRAVLDWCGDLNGKTVADAGCGKGRFARIVKDRNPDARVVAVDIAMAMLRSVPAGVLPCAGSLTAIPLASESCEAAYATESLEHAVDIEGAIAELCRILKPGGRLVIIDKNKEHWGRFKTPQWEKWFGQEELEGLLRRHCRRVESKPISYWEDETPDGLFLTWLAEK
jgi:ubiquinone/menaquinone biosynthesis C-methylase UbiE